MNYPLTSTKLYPSLLATVILLILIPGGYAHGTISCPNPRGGLCNQKDFISCKCIARQARHDPKIHFPAGDKDEEKGSGIESQRRAARGNTWRQFAPLNPDHDWRYGVCGDLKTMRRPTKLRGGRFYNGAMIVETYKQGQVIEIDISIVAHHNGFMELHICDVSKCGGEISESCFKVPGACHQLKREKNPECDSGKSQFCGPIDRNYPGRWYLPCTMVPRGPGNFDSYGRTPDGKPTILYRLPSNLNCKHCVMQWYWTSADRCNPPGIVQYFEGPDAPDWMKCPGGGGTEGGVNKRKAKCGLDRFSEEYIHCVDVRINQAIATPSPSSTSSPQSSPSPTSSPTPTATPSSSAPPTDPVTIDTAFVVVNGRREVDLGQISYYDIIGSKRVTLEAIVSGNVRSVSFSVNGQLISRRTSSPYYIGGSGSSPHWEDLDEYSDDLLALKITAYGLNGQIAAEETFYVLLQKF